MILATLAIKAYIGKSKIYSTKKLPPVGIEPGTLLWHILCYILMPFFAVFVLLFPAYAYTARIICLRESLNVCNCDDFNIVCKDIEDEPTYNCNRSFQKLKFGRTLKIVCFSYYRKWPDIVKSIIIVIMPAVSFWCYSVLFLKQN